MADKLKVLIVGSGAREHCLAWKISQSSQVGPIYCASGNGGTSLLAENIDISPDDIEGLLDFALDKKIDLTVVGPEVPLVEGIVDMFQDKGLKIFGPRKDLALLEGSKIFAKEIMRKYRVPTADFETFDFPEKAKAYLKNKRLPLVIKADGLAAGKGVIICNSIEEALKAVDMIMVDRRFGRAGDRIIIEDFIEGEEVSILVFTDGETIIPLVSSQDHKRALDNDKGLNTGGMGAYSPAPMLAQAGFEKIVQEVFVPLIEGLKKEGKTYQGILYGGLILKENKAYVLEFNVRFGDPEIQAILPKLKTDLVDIMLKTIDGRLSEVSLEWDDRFCICVVLASGGYPGSYNKGKDIKGLDVLGDLKDIFIFHAGTKRVTHSAMRAENFVTSGGRVLSVVSMGSNIKEAQDRVYSVIDKIKFEDMHYRKDIGNKALQREEDK